MSFSTINLAYSRSLSFGITASIIVSFAEGLKILAAGFSHSFGKIS